MYAVGVRNVCKCNYDLLGLITVVIFIIYATIRFINVLGNIIFSTALIFHLVPCNTKGKFIYSF